MLPSNFDESNEVLGPPSESTEDEVESLFVYRGEDDRGVPVMISCWRPTASEIEEIGRTGRIWVIVSYRRPTMVSLRASSPFQVQEA